MSKKRAIFAQVDETDTAQQHRPAVGGGLIDQDHNHWRSAARVWLIALWALVFAMIVVGGLTRLTDSGLSITEWQPISGALPPFNADDWAVAFDKYKAIPEFTLVNADMTLAQFKVIYWWEWGHRQLGRVVGLVWFVGFVILMWRYKRARAWAGRFAFLGALGGLQGAIGWWMVSSGLTGRMVDVASYRLAVHLGMAFAILSLIGWYYLRLSRQDADLLQSQRNGNARLARFASVLFVVAFAQIILGALVAGIDAGRGYVDWPLMNGQFLPDESFDYTPFWSNFFENPALVQFNHRMLGYVILLLGVWYWWRSRTAAHRVMRSNGLLVLLLIILQMLLGILTVRYSAPLELALLHQIGAVLVIGAILRARFIAIYPPQQVL